MELNIEKLNKLAEQNRTGGKGSVRRKKKVVHHNTGVDDKKLQTKLKALGVRSIPGIETVNLFKADGSIIHFVNPKVQAASKTFVVSGHNEVKSMKDLLPDIINHIGQDQIKKLAESLSAGIGKNTTTDDIPDLVENFDQ
ncbi:nascent polypeptide-associated complex NAC domain-containing protein [Tieghemostelium lacteum]|uniref:Nascent polypeptide-associated complex subunit beta n=1 Tax=Tieghemostelium lacteum TaxID=361077 RepID=A0A151ZHA6_TIELA|nr:nascent polypeptide-associated complex NAC domain-containing protein [Tieghemostelium lacteum]|eukprot:KYQ93260.1 nascent polypeptide-associated complex NAC domain-containing protein [Tieghemostelium lacteum]